tara:strand:+ start:1513 stop:1740 length:228 start_codon:yes stop_codon:yes gene_type:complete
MKKIAADKNYRMHKRALKRNWKKGERGEMVSELAALLQDRLEYLKDFASTPTQQKTIHLITQLNAEAKYWSEQDL